MGWIIIYLTKSPWRKAMVLLRFQLTPTVVLEGKPCNTEYNLWFCVYGLDEVEEMLQKTDANKEGVVSDNPPPKRVFIESQA